MTRCPGLVQRFGFRFKWDPSWRVSPITIDEEITDGQVLPIAGGLTTVHTPGHTAGHVSFLWKGTQLLIVADAWSRWIRSIADPVGFEDPQAGRASQRRLAELDFEVMTFGHGDPIRKNAVALARAAAR